MPSTRPYCLTIAGFDPSGGAGLNADVKVFEALKVQGLSVCTAVTVQTEDQFKQVEWCAQELILEQLRTLLQRYPISYCKIGLIENATVLKAIVSCLREHEQNIRIIWDPILSASAGFDFEHDTPSLVELMSNLYLATPNWPEFEQLFGHPYDASNEQVYPCAIYLKGGHHPNHPGKDYLVGKNRATFNPRKGNYHDKHGSGCILSAALTAYLSRGYDLHKAALRAKRYTEKSLASNPSLLAWHS